MVLLLLLLNLKTPRTNEKQVLRSTVRQIPVDVGRERSETKRQCDAGGWCRRRKERAKSREGRSKGKRLLQSKRRQTSRSSRRAAAFATTCTRLLLFVVFVARDARQQNFDLFDLLLLFRTAFFVSFRGIILSRSQGHRADGVENVNVFNRRLSDPLRSSSGASLSQLLLLLSCIAIACGCATPSEAPSPRGFHASRGRRQKPMTLSKY